MLSGPLALGRHDFGVSRGFRDFLGLFLGFSNPNPNLRDFGIMHSSFFGIFRGFKIPIPIPGIPGFSGFFFRDFFGTFKSRSRSPGFRDFSILPKIKNPDLEFPRSGIPKKSHPEANSGIIEKILSINK